ncbi:anion transporter [Bacillus oleivorans]|uniref:Sodium-dependent dicarboxylate transporter SdcS n=1 Tax=Bacillus oleivorans TaxID=1448271 RepID=A0A285D8C1_9BACI|nr:SLC13 family permease [Bacillus oleivorans]SNX75528.1 anion transporter [Bacillus oleivorans]
MITNRSKWMIFSSALVIFFSLFFLLQDVEWPIRISLSIMLASVPLWIFEPIPFAQIALLLLCLFLVFDVAEADLALSGFASLALFLIVAGLMIGKAVNETNLGRRIAMWFLLKLCRLKNGLLIGVILIQQVLALFIPTPSIRTALLLPILESLFKDLPPQSTNLQKQVMLGLAFAANVSAICYLPAGMVNVITIEYINQYTSYEVSYGLWFLVMLPIWVLMLPLIYFSVTKTIRVDHYPDKLFEEKIQRLKEQLPPLDTKEKKSIAILLVVVLLWVTESFHGIHPAFTAVIGAVLLSLPKVGVISWNKIVQINMDVFFIIGATFSIGNILNQSGTATYLGNLITNLHFIEQIKNPWIFIILLILFVHFYHIIITNIGTAAVTLFPIVLTVAPVLNIDPVHATLLSGVTLVFGFIFVIGTLPNLLVQSTKIVSQKDFIVPGVLLTFFSLFLTAIISIFWWPYLIT